MPTVHRVTFERNITTGQWRANCTCFWQSAPGTKFQAFDAAAYHDHPWQAAPEADTEFEMRTAQKADRCSE